MYEVDHLFILKRLFFRSYDPHFDGKSLKYNNPDDFINFCVQRKNLQSVQCSLNTEAAEDNLEKEEFAIRFLKNNLQNQSKIRELKLNIDPSYQVLLIDEELFALIVDSSLETLELRCEEMKISEGLSIRARENSFKKNTTMRSLSLKINNQETTILFLKYFTQLAHLELFNAEDDVLQAIWKYQVRV